MSELFLIEKYDDITPIPDIEHRPPSMIVLPKDSTFVSTSSTEQELLTQNAIRNQIDYIQPVNPEIHLHSMMKNRFYKDFCTTLVFEQMNLIDRANSLKTLYDVDFYDGDQDTFVEKINNLVYKLKIKFPQFFIPYTNAENSLEEDIDKINLFQRTMVKESYLLRRWAGTYIGYTLPLKFIHRLGSIYIGLKYNIPGSVSEFTEKIVRLIDVNSFLSVLPNNPNTVFPNAGGGKGIKNISFVSPYTHKYDTGVRYDFGWKEADHTTTAMQPVGDYTPYTWDQYISLNSSEQQICVEINLDRLLYHLNSQGTYICLMDMPFLQALETIIPAVQRAQDKVNIGSQITMVTSNDGKYNTLSGDINYTHPNIHAKFQVFKYKEDKSTLNWSFTKVAKIKIGQGGFNVALIDNNVFVKSTESPIDPTKVIPLDLQDPLFEIAISDNEKYSLSDYNLISTSIHQREIESSGIASSVIINGCETNHKYLKTTVLQLPDSLVTEGSVSLGVDFDINVPNLTILPLSSGLSFSSVTQQSSGIYYFYVTSLGTAIAPCEIQVGDVIRTITDVSSLSAVANQIANNPIDPLTDPASDEWTFFAEGDQIIATTKILEHHQRLLIYQQLNLEKNIFDPKIRWQERNLSGEYVDFVEKFVPYGYTVNRSYSAEYFPEVRKNIVNLLPLTIGDINSHLKTDLYGWWDMSSLLTDISGNTRTGTLVGSSQVTGYRGYGRSFNGISDYGTVPISTIVIKTISFFYKGTDVGASTSSLSTSHILLGIINESEDGVLFSTAINATGKLSFQWEDEDSIVQELVSTTTINDNEWHLITITHTESTATLYVDEALEAVNISTSLSGATYGSAYLMKSGPGYSVYTSGILDEVRFYSRALVSKEVKELSSLTLQLDTYILDSFNNLIYAHVNENEGKISIKLQYDPTGLLSDKDFITIPYTTKIVNLFQKYQLGMKKGISAISELGLFDSSDTLIAYATFPPVIYNPLDYHFSCNLIIQKDS